MTDEQARILEDTLTQIVADIRDNLASTGTNASGKTSASLTVAMRDDGGSVDAIGRPYFQSVEKGRPPGRVPYRFDIIIRQWMADKGITAPPVPYKRQPSDRWQPKYTPEERGAMQMAAAIAHRIKTEGSRLFRDGGRRDIYSDVLDRRVAELEEKLTINIIQRID